MVFHHQAFQVHFIEEGEIDMFYFDACVEIFGKAGGYFAYDPVLTKGSLNKDPCRNQQEKHGEKEPKQYFLEFPQRQLFTYKNT